MSDTTASGDGLLKPVTRAEVVALSHDLLRFAERLPQAGDDPFMMLLARLLISVDRSHRELLGLREQLDGSLEGKDRLRYEHDLTTEEAIRLKEDLADREARLSLARRALDELQTEVERLRRDKMEAIPALERVAALEKALTKATSERDAALKTASEAQVQISNKEKALNTFRRLFSTVEAQRNKYQTSLRDLQGRVQLVRGYLDKIEWSGQHRMRDQLGRPGKSCLFCGRPSTEYNHTESGHLRNCMFLTLRNVLSE